MSNKLCKLIISNNAACLSLRACRSSLTGGKTASEEHVEQVFRSDVSLKAPVEIKASSLRVTRTAQLLASRQVILPSFVWVAQHSICITDL